MNENLIYTDSRPRAKGTGHAFGFEGNQGMPVIVSIMVSVFMVTLLLNSDNNWPLLAKLLVSLAPTVATSCYIVLLRHKRPPRFDVDLLASLVNGRSFQPAKVQPRHPLHR
jgi:hypothetical protein